MEKSYYCEKLENTLHFLPDGVKYCCSCTKGIGLEIEDFNKFDMNDVISKRDYYIQSLKEGDLPKGCIGCTDYKERTIKSKIASLFKLFDKNKISHIIIDHFKQCDCNCTYCAQKKLFPQTTQNYELLPIIKNLYEKNYINSKNLKVEFQGGNVSVLSEFPLLMQEFKNHQAKEYVILSNMIKYLPELEELGENDILTVSVDAGTKETFQRIKNVDAFDEVIANIRKLRNNSKIQYKYIILQNQNDNIEEVKNFLNIAKEIGGLHIVIDIDYNDTFMTPGVRFDVPKHYYDIMKFIDEYCKENYLGYSVRPSAQITLDKGYSE